MEMCYNGALVMPENYAIIADEEMTYIDGGIAVPNWLVGGAINLAISALFASLGGVLAKGAANNIAAAIRAAGRGAVEAKIRTYVQRAAGFTIASWVCGWIPSAMTLFGAIVDPGGSIAGWLDSKDSKPNNGYLNI